MNYSMIKNFVIMTLVTLNLTSALIIIAAVDSITTIYPVIALIINITFLFLFGLANGYIYNTKRYKERMEKKHDKVQNQRPK